MAELLYTDRYVKPGCYIGQIITPTASIATATRMPTAIGKGSKYALSSNASIVRSYVYEEEINFSITSPYRALLKHNALMDKNKAVLIRASDNSEIPESKWFFEDSRHLVIAEDVFEAGTFKFSYQSTDENLTDITPVLDIMSFVAVGDTPDAQKYKEGRDFFLEMGMSDITKIDGTAQDFLAFDTRYKSESVYPTCTGPIPSSLESGSLLFDVSNYKVNKDIVCNIKVEDIKTVLVDGVSVVDRIVFYYEYQECDIEGTPITGATKYKSTVTIKADGSFHEVLAGVKVLIEEGTQDKFRVNDIFENLIIVQGRIFLTAKDNRTVKVKLSNKDTGFNNLNVTLEDFDGDYRNLFDDEAETPFVFSGKKIVGTYGYEVRTGTVKNDNGVYKMPITVKYLVGGYENSYTSLVEVVYRDETYSTGTSGFNLDCGDGLSIKIKADNTSVEPPVRAIIPEETLLFTFNRIVERADAYRDAKAQFYYTSSTLEGGFGTIDVYENVGTIILPGNVIINYDISNVEKGTEFIFNITNENRLNWGLTQRITEVFRPSEVFKDTNGSVTGVFGSYYVSLTGIPLTGVFVTCGDTKVKSVPVMDKDGNPTSFVRFIDDNGDPIKPSLSVNVTYEYKGSEPKPGSTYYLSTTHVRPSTWFNTVIVVSSREEGRTIFGPATPNNDLYIANEIAWDELSGTQGAQVAFIQMKDSDDDGVYNEDDVKLAIDACTKTRIITDVTLLGFFESFGYLLKMNQNANDPFAMRENEVWAGCPIDTPIGDVNTEGSLVFTAKTTMKVDGNDPSHGTRILVGSTWAKRSVTMYGGKSQVVTMDGSFVAWGLACLRSSLPTSESILRKNLTCFSDMQIWDSVDNDKLGAAQIVYFSKIASGMFRIEEDFTVDTFGFEFSIEQITSQRLMAVRSVRSYIDENMVGVTPDTPQAGINLVTDFLIRGLNKLITNGTIGNYLDEKGNKRPINPSLDVFVQNVKDSPTQYQFGFDFFTKKVMKQFFGTYVVDKNFSSLGLGNS